MDFAYTDEQRLLSDSVNRWIDQQYDFARRKSVMSEPPGWSRAAWSDYEELGLLGLPFAEDYGGFGGGGVETMIVMEAFGRGLVLEPFFATVVLAGGILRLGDDAAKKDSLLPRIAGGELVLAFAHGEFQSRYDLADVGTSAVRDGGGWRLNGRKCVVLHGDSADQLIVSARISGERRDRAGIGLFLVDGNAPGVTRKGYKMVDGVPAANIDFADVRITADGAIGEPGNALPLIERVVDTAIAALAAESIGILSAMHALTIDYLKTRKQFGVAIGSFQALQHRAADMLVSLELARSMALHAVMMAEEPDPTTRHAAVAAAKIQIGRSARHIGQQAVQLHGGIGITAEYALGHYFKRATVIDTLFGDADHHLVALAAAGGLTGVD